MALTIYLQETKKAEISLSAGAGITAISAETQSSCAFQNVLRHFPDGCPVVVCYNVFDTFNQAVHVLRMLITNFPWRFYPEMKI